MPWPSLRANYGAARVRREVLLTAQRQLSQEETMRFFVKLTVVLLIAFAAYNVHQAISMSEHRNFIEHIVLRIFVYGTEAMLLVTWFIANSIAELLVSAVESRKKAA